MKMIVTLLHKEQIQTTMKKLLLFAATAGLLFSACQKDESSNPLSDSNSSANKTYTPPTTGSVSPVPSSFLKKAMVEEFVGTQVAAAPEASFDLESIVKGSNDRVYAASLHVSDDMSTFQTPRVLSMMGNSNPTLPCGIISRQGYNGQIFFNSKQFNGALNTLLNKPVDCGLAITSVVLVKRIIASIHYGFTATMPGTYKVTAYLIEDKVQSNNPIFDQANAFNNNPNSIFYQAGNPIKSYQHRYIVRNTLTAPTGNAINPAANIPGGSDIISLQFDMPGKYSAIGNYKILCFLTDAATNEVVNVQQADIGTTKDWN
ncbi:hypothetical protein BH11BAC2_BH11BAC2_13760 [soil metagenome]